MGAGEGFSEQSAVTAALVAWKGGDSGAADRLLALIYPELHRIAERQMRRERGGHTLQPTALVHEAYLKLVDQAHVDWRNRAHFFGVAAQAMRRLLGRAEQEGRTDDTPEVIAERMRVYHEQTEPLIAYYRAGSVLVRIDASSTVDEVYAQVTTVLGAPGRGASR